MSICPADLEKVRSKMLPGHATHLGMMIKEFWCNLLDIKLRNKSIHSVVYNLKRLFWFVDCVDSFMLSWKPTKEAKLVMHAYVSKEENNLSL